jgi:hypothetical protein
MRIAVRATATATALALAWAAAVGCSSSRGKGAPSAADVAAASTTPAPPPAARPPPPPRRRSPRPLSTGRRRRPRGSLGQRAAAVHLLRAPSGPADRGSARRDAGRSFAHDRRTAASSNRSRSRSSTSSASASRVCPSPTSRGQGRRALGRPGTAVAFSERPRRFGRCESPGGARSRLAGDARSAAAVASAPPPAPPAAMSASRRRLRPPAARWPTLSRRSASTAGRHVAVTLQGDGWFARRISSCRNPPRVVVDLPA